MSVKHIRRNYSEQNSPASGKMSVQAQQQMPSRMASHTLPHASSSDGNKKSWIAPLIIILILILCLFFFMRKGKSGTTAYFY
jgi:uncharacterized membrane protein